MKLMSVDNECQKYTFNGFNKCEVLLNADKKVPEKSSLTQIKLNFVTGSLLLPLVC